MAKRKGKDKRPRPRGSSRRPRWEIVAWSGSIDGVEVVRSKPGCRPIKVDPKQSVITLDIGGDSDSDTDITPAGACYLDPEKAVEN